MAGWDHVLLWWTWTEQGRAGLVWWTRDATPPLLPFPFPPPPLFLSCDLLMTWSYRRANLKWPLSFFSAVPSEPGGWMDWWIGYVDSTVRLWCNCAKRMDWMSGSSKNREGGGYKSVRNVRRRGISTSTTPPLHILYTWSITRGREGASHDDLASYCQTCNRGSFGGGGRIAGRSFYIPPHPWKVYPYDMPRNNLITNFR